jgi:ligand-binding sensor domain-containing protein
MSQYVHDVWTTNDGLPQDSINAIAQTPDGYLWLATQEGLARFDGMTFTTFDAAVKPPRSRRG